MSVDLGVQARCPDVVGDDADPGVQGVTDGHRVVGEADQQSVAFDDLGERPLFGLGGLASGVSGLDAFQRGSYGVELLDVPGAEQGHHDAPGRELLDQIFGQQQLDRLTQRSTAHLEACGQFRLVQPGPRCQFEVEDLPFEFGVDNLPTRDSEPLPDHGDQANTLYTCTPQTCGQVPIVWLYT